MAMCDSNFDLPNVCEMPHQLVQHSFPKCAFGKTKVSSRAFQGRTVVREMEVTVQRLGIVEGLIN